MCTGVFGSSGVLDRVAAQCDLDAPAVSVTLDDWMAVPVASTPTVVDCGAIDSESVEPGVVAEACGRAAYTFTECAIHAALRGEVGAVSTAPIHKEALHLAGVPYPGHTEIFAALSGADRACMMLASDEITTSFVTTHIGIIDVPSALTRERVLEVIELTTDAMQRLRWEWLTVVAKLAPGVASTWVVEAENLIFTMKPGSYQWPDELIRSHRM